MRSHESKGRMTSSRTRQESGIASSMLVRRIRLTSLLEDMYAVKDFQLLVCQMVLGWRDLDRGEEMGANCS